MNGYAQDDFRLLSGITLNIGLRYEYFSPDTELRGSLADIVLNPAMTQAAVVTPGTVDPFTGGKLPSSLVRPDKEAFSPQLGSGLASLAKTCPGNPLRLQHFLQRLRLQSDCQPDGIAAAVCKRSGVHYADTPIR